MMIQSDGSTCSYTALLEYTIMSAYLASKQSDKLQQSNARADIHMAACKVFSSLITVLVLRLLGPEMPPDGVTVI